MIKGMKKANGEVRVPVEVLLANKDAGFAEYVQARAADEAMHAFCSDFDYDTLYLICRKWISREESYAGARDAVFRETIAYKEVVTCKDCKHRYKEDELVAVVINRCKLNHNLAQSDDWFCADGERREE